MFKVSKIANIELEHPLWVKESFAIKSVQAKAFNTIGGGAVVYESIKRNSALYLTLISKDSGWVREETLQQIRDIADSLGVEINLTSTMGQIRARFAYERGEVIKAEPLYEGSRWYRVEILMCAV